MAGSRFGSALLAAVIGLVPIAPPEHVHEVEEHGHHHSILHRHVDEHGTPHSLEHHPAVDDHDAPALTLTVFYVVPDPAGSPAIPVPVVRTIVEPPTEDLLAPSSPYVERIIHGPPRAPAGLRAPPAPLAS